jgi:hypothetical protein
VTVNANTLGALSAGFKYHYDKEVPDLIRKDSAMLDMLQEDKGFTKKLGGRQLIWELLVDRAMNIGVRTEDGFFPGLSGNSQDDIDRVSTVEASLSRAYAYADVAFTEQMMADAHKDFEFFKGWGFAKHVKMMQDDFRMQLEWMLLGDGTGILGVVSSLSHAGGTTTVTVQPASTISARGVHGTQRLYKNLKVSFIRTADFASNPHRAQIDSNVAGTGRSIHKITAATRPNSVGTCTIAISGDLTAATALAAGDVIVLGDSRASNSGGGVAASDALADLRVFEGLFSMIDDGTLKSTIFGLTRSSNTVLNSLTNLSSTGRDLTWQMLQVMFDNLYRRRGSEDTDIENEYILFSERGVRTRYVAQEGENNKRYIQEDRAKKLVAGFKDVTFAFLGNDTMLPWVAYNTVPYGHALLMRKKDLKVMWDIPPGIVSADGLTLRQVDGKPVYYMALQGVGNFKKDEPWLDARISGLNGTYS